MRWTQEEYRAYLEKNGTKEPKYHNKKVEYNGALYDSMKEAKYAQELDLRIHAREVISVERQKRYQLDVAGVHICDYILDFCVTLPGGKLEYVDVKGYKKGIAYRMFTMKKSLMLACHGIDVLEV